MNDIGGIGNSAGRLITSEYLMPPHRPLTEKALAYLNRDTGALSALDCGCGTGADMAYLYEQGLQVKGFDIRTDAVDICQRRFAGTDAVQVSESSFQDFDYPAADLILAHSSLFFCPQDEFAGVWQAICRALPAGGIIAGDFLGINDSWVSSPEHVVSAFSRAQLDELFADFEILWFEERDADGKTALGRSKHWHMVFPDRPEELKPVRLLQPDDFRSENFLILQINNPVALSADIQLVSSPEILMINIIPRLGVTGISKG